MYNKIVDKMFGTKLAVVLILGCLSFCKCLSNDEPRVCYNKFEYEYNVLQKLVMLEEKMKLQDDTNDKIRNELQDANEIIKEMKNELIRAQRSFDGSTYIRWGRTVCPQGAIKVYDGYAAGGHHKHPGSGSNYLCMTKNPTWNEYSEGFQKADRIYGAEYHTSDYPFSKQLYHQDVPCAMCRIPRNNVLMIPGRNICYEDYVLEYSGYLMSGYHSHASSSEYICVDDKPEALEAGNGAKDEKYMFYVEAACGVLKCPPYKNARELTCAVCSFSPQGTNKTKA